MKLRAGPLALACLFAVGAARGDSSVGARTPVPGREPRATPSCPRTRPPGRPDPSLAGCKRDADCAQGANGRCLTSFRRMRINYCSYDQCFTDGECATKGEKRLCACRLADDLEANVCLPGNCHGNGDCRGGKTCAPSRSACGQIGGYFCHTTADTCASNGDCTRDARVCAFDALQGRWTCLEMMCPPG